MHVYTKTELEHFAPDAFRFYYRVRELLHQANIPFLIGGAYAFHHYTGILRHTKDLDLFVQPTDVNTVMEVLAAVGYKTEMMFSHWLAKAFHGTDFVDIIYSSGNGLCPVDETWFRHAVAAEVLGMQDHLVPAEEMIWQKAYIMERERFDGADINHLLRARGAQLDWDRLLTRFGAHGRVLLAHLLLFGFVYPDQRDKIPGRVIQQLIAEVQSEATPDRYCYGPLLSRTQYLPDLEEWHSIDPRLAPNGTMTREEVTRWTDAGR